MFSHKYERFEQASKEPLLDDDNGACQCGNQTAALAKRGKAIFVLIIMLGFAVLSNVFFAVRLHHAQTQGHEMSFTGLERNLELSIPHDHRTIDDPMWDAPEFDWNAGWIALDHEYAEDRGLPSSMNWPWDHSKGIYVLHGFHSIHCVFVLRDSIMQFRDGIQQNWPIEHVTHCLHVLREDTTCNADDTPRYTGHLHAQENNTVLFSGVGQNRKCRDWNQLYQYANENSACYRRDLYRQVPLLDRYKSCPDGSTPWQGMDQKF